MTRILEDRRIALLLVASAALLVYANSLWNGFAYDDLWIVFENHRIHQLEDMRQIWLTPYWPDWGTQLGLYRPLTIFFFALQWAAGNGAPWVFHLVNVVLHAVVCVVLYLLAERLFNRTVAFATALVFAIHPLHTEAVANVVGQAEIWASLGVLAGCLIYVRRPPGIGISYARMSAILAIYGVSLMAKEHAVVLPGLLLLLDFVQRRVELTRAGLKRYAHATGFMFALCCVVLLGYLTLRVHVLGSFGGTDVAPGLPFLKEGHRVLNGFRAWPEFVRLLFVPLDLSVSYTPAMVLPVDTLTPMVMLGMFLTAATLALTIVTPWAPLAGVAAGWFLISILPVSNFFFPIGVLIAERTLYLPSVAVCFLAGFAWQAVLRSQLVSRRRLGYAAALIIVVAFSARTVIRNPDWKSLRRVWQGLARDHPESYLSQWVYAATAASMGQAADAERYFLLAKRIWPHDARFLMEFANFYLEERQYERAIPLLEQSVKLTPWSPRTQELLAYAYVSTGRAREALAAATRANGMEGSQKVLNASTIAAAYEQLHQYDKAAGAWRVAARSPNGGFWLHYASLARALARAGRLELALAAADSAYVRAPAGSPMQQAVVILKDAIRTGCYQSNRTNCDPLVNWTFSAGSPFKTGGK